MVCARLSWWMLIVKCSWWLGTFVLSCVLLRHCNTMCFFSIAIFQNSLLDIVSTSVIIADRRLWWWVCSVFAVLRSRGNRRSWSLGKLCITPGLNPLGPESFVGSVGHTVGSSRTRRYCATPGIAVDNTGFAILYFIPFVILCSMKFNFKNSIHKCLYSSM